MSNPRKNDFLSTPATTSGQLGSSTKPTSSFSFTPSTPNLLSSGLSGNFLGNNTNTNLTLSNRSFGSSSLLSSNNNSFSNQSSFGSSSRLAALNLDFKLPASRPPALSLGNSSFNAN